MLDHRAYKLLSLYADGQDHSFFETCLLARVLLKKGDKAIWEIFKKELLANGLLSRQWKSWSEHLDFYILTPRGDECFRARQISLLKRGRHDDDVVRHYRHFDRTVTGKYGTQSMGKDVTEKIAGLREKYPELYRPIDEW